MKSKSRKGHLTEPRSGHPSVMEIVDFKLKMKRLADDPENDKTMLGIIATRAAIDLDHVARIISSPAIDCGSYWVQVTAKHKKDRKTLVAEFKKHQARPT